MTPTRVRVLPPMRNECSASVHAGLEGPGSRSDPATPSVFSNGFAVAAPATADVLGPAAACGVDAGVPAASFASKAMIQAVSTRIRS